MVNDNIAHTPPNEKHPPFSHRPLLLKHFTDELNIPQLLNHQVHLLAGAAFQLGSLRDREAYPVVLPILSLLVNYGTLFILFPALTIHKCSSPPTTFPQTNLSLFSFRLLHQSLLYIRHITTHCIT